MLVLLIVFMVTAPLLTQGLKVDLPEASSEPIEIDENTETLVVSISADGLFYLSLGATEAEETPEAVELELVGEQVGKIVAVNPQIQVFVEGDGQSSYSSFIDLMSVLQSAGVASPNLITKPLE